MLSHIACTIARRFRQDRHFARRICLTVGDAGRGIGFRLLKFPDQGSNFASSSVGVPSADVLIGALHMLCSTIIRFSWWVRRWDAVRNPRGTWPTGSTLVRCAIPFIPVDAESRFVPALVTRLAGAESILVALFAQSSCDEKAEQGRHECNGDGENSFVIPHEVLPHLSHSVKSTKVGSRDEINGSTSRQPHYKVPLRRMQK